MFNFSKKKTIYCLIGIGISILVMALGFYFGIEGKSLVEIPFWAIVLRYIAITSMTLILGFIFLIFFDKKFFWFIVGLFQAYIIIYGIIFYTSKTDVVLSWIIFSVLVLSGLLFMFIREYKAKQISINGLQNKKISKKEQQEIEQLEKSALEDAKLKEQVKYLEKSILVGSQMGTLFQMIKTDDAYYFHNVGSILKGIDDSKFLSDFDNLDGVINNNKKDFKIAKIDISTMQAKLNFIPQQLEFGTLIIKLKDGKTKRLGFANLIEKDDITQFFDNNIEIIEKDSYKEITEENTKELTNDEKIKLNKVNLFIMLFSVISSFIFTFYIFFNNQYTNAILSTICVILTISSFAIYIILNKYLRLDTNRFNSNDVVNGKISYVLTFFFFPILMALKCSLNLIFVVSYDYVNLIIFSVVLLVLLLALFLIFTKEYKVKKGAIALAVIVLLALCPSCVAKINSGLDFTPPQEIACVVVEKPTHTDNNDKITYYLTIKYNDRDIKTEVEKEKYDITNIGDNVVVLRYNGLLGIEKVLLKE